MTLPAFSRRIWPEYLFVLFVAGVLYCLTCAQTVQWQDTALMTYRILHNDLEGKLGLALAHPLHILAGIAVKQIPFGDLARKMNLAVAIFAAISIANVYLVIRLWFGRRFPAAAAAMTLMLSWTFWLHATIGEVYPLYAAIVTTEMIFLLKYVQSSQVKWLYVLAFLNGLSIADHLTGIIPLGCYLVLIAMLLGRRKIGISQAALMAALWIAGALPYEALIVKQVIETGDIPGVLSSAIWGASWEKNVLNVSLTRRMVLENVAFVLMNFPTPNIVFLLTGIFAVIRLSPTRGFAAVVLGMLVLFFVFAFRYTVPDRHAFFLPFYIIACVCIGAGIHAFTLRMKGKLVPVAILAMALLPIPAYCAMPAVARGAYKGLAERRQIPYRDDYTYWLVPWHTGYDGGARFAREALGQVERNAFIYADEMTVYSILYMQVCYGLRPDVKVISNYDSGPGAVKLSKENAGEMMCESAVYVVSPLPGYCPEFIFDKNGQYETIKEGVLYKLLNKPGC